MTPKKRWQMKLLERARKGPNEMPWGQGEARRRWREACRRRMERAEIRTA